jgi:hypothetical protein
MQIDYVKISCKKDVHICHTNFAKKMERNLPETTSRWKNIWKTIFFRGPWSSRWWDLEVRDDGTLKFEMMGPWSSRWWDLEVRDDGTLKFEMMGPWSSRWWDFEVWDDRTLHYIQYFIFIFFNNQYGGFLISNFFNHNKDSSIRRCMTLDFKI